MLPRCLQLFRPKRRWFQYRLRTLFVLMTLVCVWLNYDAWRYHREEAIVAGILTKDPQAVVVWGGPSWLNWLDEDSVPLIFRRVEAITLKQEDVSIPAGLSELQLQKLSSLKQLTLRGWFASSDKQKERQRSTALKELLPGTKVLFFGDVVRAWEQLVIDYLKNPTDEAAAVICRAMGPPWRFVYPPFSAAPDNIDFDPVPLELKGMPVVGEVQVVMVPRPTLLDNEEEHLAKLLACRHKNVGIVAARHLWVRHSRRHASKVIAFATTLTADSDMARELKSIVEADVAPGKIDAELRRPVGDDPAWWAWLAAVHPHPSLAPIILRLSEDKDPSPEITYALRHVKDARPLGPWLKLLAESREKRVRCIAADAIGEIGDSAAEPELLKALQREDSLTRSAACDALAKVGTPRSLPALRKLFADKSDQDGFNVAGAARRAVEEVEWRLRVKKTP